MPLRAARKRRRGVALTEALIACVMITVLFASVVFFHNVYVVKARALRAARLQAWQATDMSCKDGGHGKAALAANVPRLPYTRASSPNVGVGARLEMTCNEHNSQNDDMLAIFEWAGLGNPIDSLFSAAADFLF